MSSENRTSVPNSLNEHWMPFTSKKDFGKEFGNITMIMVNYMKKEIIKINITMKQNISYVIFQTFHQSIQHAIK